MIVKINDDFTEHGLTLEEAYILERVKYYDDEEIPCIESNLTIAKIMGKSESTVKRTIESLIKKGYLTKETVRRTRILTTSKGQNEPNRVQNDLNRVQNEPSNGHIELNEESKHSSINNLSKEEQLKKIQEALDRMPKANREDFY